MSALDSADNSQLSVLAEEIRHFRKKNNFSLEMLAEASGVSRSMISKIERCETVPSTVILSKLAEALGVTFSQLMAPAVEREIVHIPAARQPILRDEESGFLRRCISPVLPGRGIDWVLNTLPPEAETGNFVAHRRGVEEYIFVLRGRMRVSIGDQRVNLNQGIPVFPGGCGPFVPESRQDAVRVFPRDRHREGKIVIHCGGSWSSIGDRASRVQSAAIAAFSANSLD